MKYILIHKTSPVVELEISAHSGQKAYSWASIIPNSYLLTLYSLFALAPGATKLSKLVKNTACTHIKKRK